MHESADCTPEALDYSAILARAILTVFLLGSPRVGLLFLSFEMKSIMPSSYEPLAAFLISATSLGFTILELRWSKRPPAPLEGAVNIAS